MKFASRTNTVLFSLCLVATGQLQASGYFPDELKDVQSRPLLEDLKALLEKIPNPYRQPHVPNPGLKTQGLSCAQLQRAINKVRPLTYSYKPRPYDDPIVGASALAGTFVLFPFYLGMSWSTFMGYKEEKRMEIAQNRLEDLRQLKAERHCFECRGGSACP